MTLGVKRVKTHRLCKQRENAETRFIEPKPRKAEKKFAMQRKSLQYKGKKKFAIAKEVLAKTSLQTFANANFGASKVLCLSNNSPQFGVTVPRDLLEKSSPTPVESFEGWVDQFRMTRPFMGEPPEEYVHWGGSE